MQRHYSILLVGSGLMTTALVDYLISFQDTHITVGSNLFEEAQKIAQKNTSLITPAYLDVFNEQQLDKLVGQNDVVISFVPPTMHMPVAKSCLKLNKHLVTSSYISPAMQELDAEAKSKGLIFLNECGLDPGIDIMSTMKVVHEAEERGIKVVGYESYCGGLPIAEQADNPLGFKFSWNPGAAIKASKNKCTFKKNGQLVEHNEPLKLVEERDDFTVAMKLEVYPNRNSLEFQERFEMNHCETFIRGTIRFKGFSYIISAFHDLGLTSDLLIPEGVKTLRDFVNSLTYDADTSKCHAFADEAIDSILLGINSEDRDFLKRFLAKVDVSYIDEKQIKLAYRSIINSIRFFGFMDDPTPLKIQSSNGKQLTYIELFGELMSAKLSMNEDDIDLVIMKHCFTLEDKNKQRWNHYSTLINFGQPRKIGGFTSMSKTVGYTAAIGARLILEGRIPQRGVLSPIYKEIYNPALKELERLGIIMLEESSRVQPRPRL